MTKPRTCPECGSNGCARIIYGFPVTTRKLLQQLRSDRVVLGGPVEDEYSPQWKCLNCGAELYDRRTKKLAGTAENEKKREKAWR